MFDALIEWLKEFFYPFFLWLYDTFWWLVSGFLTVIGWALSGLLTYLFWGLGKIFFTICDGVFIFVHGFFSTLDLSSLAFSSSVGSELNEQLVWIISQLGIVQCVTLLGSAIAIRALLNLIPATLTRI